jgi:hypothetical protein
VQTQAQLDTAAGSCRAAARAAAQQRRFTTDGVFGLRFRTTRSRAYSL